MVKCECNHLTNFACLVVSVFQRTLLCVRKMMLQLFHFDKDISIRLRNNENGNQTAVIFPHEFDLALEITSYIGVLLSLGGLSIFLLTHLIFK